MRLIYCGIVHVSSTEIDDFISTAECLKIDGLAAEDPSTSSHEDTRVIVFQRRVIMFPACILNYHICHYRLQLHWITAADFLHRNPIPLENLVGQDMQTVMEVILLNHLHHSLQKILVELKTIDMDVVDIVQNPIKARLKMEKLIIFNLNPFLSDVNQELWDKVTAQKAWELFHPLSPVLV